VKILVVEDHPTNRKLLKAQLEAEGHDVIETRDGVEALEALHRDGADVVISDILMPNMDGFRLCHEIRRSPVHSQLPFILYTSTYNSPADRQLAVTVGADGFVTKPAPVAVLRRAIEQATARANGSAPAPLTEHDENYVLKRYSEALVRKLEEKNFELETALAEISNSHQAILDLNAELESRVEQRTRQLADANRELEAFSFSVSHDLRAPLRRIHGFARLLESGIDDDTVEERQTAITTILNSVKEMGRLIEDLLAFSRSGRVELKGEVVSLEEIVGEVLAGLSGDINDRLIEWERSPLPAVWGDPSLLKQVFVNLLGNAIKYTRPRNPARIALSVEGTEADFVVLCVRDNGVGFDSDHAGKLFGVFQRLHRAEEFEGTGIGLAIVQRIVERHGGRIWAESVQGEGATFRFTLRAA